jgi:hypothetical protein
MPLTTLPAPEIEIGSRLPVFLIVTRIRMEKCDPIHNWSGKLAHDPERHAFGPRPDGCEPIFRKKIMLKKIQRDDNLTDHGLV